jgi:hypothetical protein
MPIKFDCPHCKKSISAKDHLAGKKVKCPACKQALTVPAPVAAPAADVEELAMAVLGEKAAEQPAEEAAKPIEFTCPQCDEPVQVAAELGGKQTPCPHCRRIIKVPMPARTEPKDWRQARTTGPSGARENQQAALEGAWGSTAAARTVSHESLLDAGAIPEAVERLTPKQWAIWVGGGVAVVVALGFVGWYVYSSRARNQDARAIDGALGVAKQLSEKGDKAAAGELYRGAGEYILRTRTPGCKTPALAHFHEARTRLAESSASERGPLLIELAVTQLELGGSQADVDKDLRIGWTKGAGGRLGNTGPRVDQEVQQTLEQLHAPEAQLAAIRELSREYVSRGQAPLAAALAARLAPADLQAEAAALAGLEMWLGRDPDKAELQAKAALDSLPPPAKGKKPTISPTLIALCLALEKPKLLEGLPEEARAGVRSDNPAVLLGCIQGLALLPGKEDAARQVLTKLTTPQDRLEGRLALAAAALAAKQSDQAAKEQAVKELEAASAEVQQRGRGISPWVVLRLIQLGARAGLAEQHLQPLPAAIGDPGLRGWAQLEVLRARLAASKTKAGDDWADAVDGKTAAASLAREALARHNARLDAAGTQAAVQQWPEPYRPFGVIGALLGRQDGQ